MFKRYVSCGECKCLMNKEDAHKVEVSNRYFPINLFYCMTHKKPYDRIVVNYYGSIDFLKEIKVDGNGIPIGYEVIKNKK